MAVNKNFVVKNGLEVNSSLIFADSNTNKVGIGSTIPRATLDVNGEVSSDGLSVVGVGTITDEFNIGVGGTVLTALPVGYVGVNTDSPEYILDVRSPVSTGQTALYVYGDVRVTGDINLDDINLDSATINSLNILQNLVLDSGSNLNVVSGVSTLGGYVIADNIEVVGVSTFDGVKITSGIITASSPTGIVTYYGDASKLSNVPPGSAGGSDTQIQYNNVGFFTGSPDLTFDGTTFRTLSGIVTNLSGTDLSYSGIGTIVNIRGTDLDYTGFGTIANLSGTSISYVEGDITNLDGTNINYSGVGTIANVVGTNINYSGVGTIATLSGTNVVYTNGSFNNLSAVNSYVTGISSVGAAITMYASSGIISATKFYGDGSNLTNITAGGIGTVLGSTQGTLLTKIYKTPTTFAVAAGTTEYIESDSSSGFIAYTALDEIVVSTGATVHIGAGTTLRMNILNIFP